MSESEQLSAWKGAFGGDYMQRNPRSQEACEQAQTVFARVFEEAGIAGSIRSILEVGANVGINLAGMRAMPGGDKLELSAVEPNPQACATLKSNSGLRLSSAECCDCYRMPFTDASFDLVFTRGVLIHVPPQRLDDAIREILRVSARYVLCMEYFSHTPQALEYRGESGLLWKCDFGSRYLDVDPSLSLKKYGFIWMKEFSCWDNINWWIFEKKDA